MTGAVPADLLRQEQRPALSRLLLDHARGRRWFRAKSRPIAGARLADVIPLGASATLALLEVSYEPKGGDGDGDIYVMPLGAADAATVARLQAEAPHAIVAVVGEQTLVDGLVTGDAATPLFEAVRAGAALRGEAGVLRGQPAGVFEEVAGTTPGAPQLPRVEQTNSTVVFGERALMKIYRQLTAGPNPELEVGSFLTAHGRPGGAPRVLGALTYVGDDGREHGLGIVHEFLANEGDAWSMTLRAVREFLAVTAGRALPAGDGAAPLGAYAARAATLGRRTGELHRALAGAPDDPAFAPEPLTAADRNAQADEVAAMWAGQAATLAPRLPSLDGPLQARARALLSDGGRQRLAAVLDAFRRAPLDVVKTRTHGDLHLGQVLCRGDDFVIIDFEGEPSRPLAQRRAKSSPLRDVMGMVRSFDYATGAVLREGSPAAPDAASTAWARVWTRQVTDLYLRSYLETVARAPFLPGDPGQQAVMLAFHELQKVVYEVGYELDNRPDWLAIPLAGLAELVGRAELAGRAGIAALGDET